MVTKRLAHHFPGSPEKCIFPWEGGREAGQHLGGPAGEDGCTHTSALGHTPMVGSSPWPGQEGELGVVRWWRALVGRFWGTTEMSWSWLAVFAPEVTVRAVLIPSPGRDLGKPLGSPWQYNTSAGTSTPPFPHNLCSLSQISDVQVNVSRFAGWQV